MAGAAAMVTKVIVSNSSLLTAKYGAQTGDVRNAVDSLIQADKQRGLDSRLILLDDAASFTGIPAFPVTDGTNPTEVKTCVDAIYHALEPDYIAILGSPDVVPHQSLDNPLHANGDEDATVPSDLPYACEHPASNDSADFLAPTRVVGRIPDITASGDPQYLVGLLHSLATWQAQQPEIYKSCFSLTAKEWEQSSTLNVQAVIGNADDLQTSPAAGPSWTPAEIQRRLHFINCHGASADYHFYGQDGSNYPVAHDASLIKGMIEAGTVVAAECCYGAELYDPALASGVPSICSTYLAGGAYAFFGSTTIAYGPADHNANADLICQYFLCSILAGASTGRATLQARQQYIRAAAPVDPTDLKTLAQFNLLGDPSIQPVSSPQTFAKGLPAAAGFALRARRRNLLAEGLATRQATAVARPVPSGEDDRGLGAQLAELTGEPRLAESKITTYAVEEPPLTAGMKALWAPRVSSFSDERIHIGLVPPDPALTGVKRTAGIMVVVAQEEGARSSRGRSSTHDERRTLRHRDPSRGVARFQERAASRCPRHRRTALRAAPPRRQPLQGHGARQSCRKEAAGRRRRARFQLHTHGLVRTRRVGRSLHHGLRQSPVGRIRGPEFAGGGCTCFRARHANAAGVGGTDPP